MATTNFRDLKFSSPIIERTSNKYKFTVMCRIVDANGETKDEGFVITLRQDHCRVDAKAKSIEALSQPIIEWIEEEVIPQRFPGLKEGGVLLHGM